MINSLARTIKLMTLQYFYRENQQDFIDHVHQLNNFNLFNSAKGKVHLLERIKSDKQSSNSQHLQIGISHSPINLRISLNIELILELSSMQTSAVYTKRFQTTTLLCPKLLLLHSKNMINGKRRRFLLVNKKN
jgi:hypothetical protein